MAILWAEHVTLNTAKEDNGIFERVREEFSEEEVIELTLMSGFFNLFNRLTDSLHIPVENQDEVDKIKRSVHLDPEKLHGYLSKMVEHWPSDIPEPSAD
jgi:hypothetical protein